MRNLVLPPSSTTSGGLEGHQTMVNCKRCYAIRHPALIITPSSPGQSDGNRNDGVRGSGCLCLREDYMGGQMSVQHHPAGPLPQNIAPNLSPDHHDCSQLKATLSIGQMKLLSSGSTGLGFRQSLVRGEEILWLLVHRRRSLLCEHREATPA